MVASHTSISGQNNEEELDLPCPSCLVDNLERAQRQNLPKQGCTPEPNSGKTD
jgi:hypothetical protein